MSTLVQSPFEVFLDRDGTPLEGGKVYIGTVGQNPETNPINVFWDSALTIPAAQPIRTSGGYPYLSGTPARVFVSDDYSITVKDRNDALVFSDWSGSAFSSSSLLAKIKSLDGSGSGLVAEGVQSTQITDLNFDPTLLGLSVREIRIYTTSLNPANQPNSVNGGYYTIVLSQPAIGEYRVEAFPSLIIGTTFRRSWTSSAWQSWSPGVTLLTSGSPYTASKYPDATYIINASTNPYVFNLFAATGSGYRVRIINTSTASTGLVKIVPSSGDTIWSAGANVAWYLQNYDQANYKTGNKDVVLVDSASGIWSVESGQPMPEPGSIDTAQTQYFLGNLRHLPLGNTTDRSISITTPAATAFSSAVQITGVKGVPVGAKAIRARCQYFANASVSGTLLATQLSFTDNNTSAPTINTAHPIIVCRNSDPSSAAADSAVQELDIPLNSSGQLYVYCSQKSNATSEFLWVVPLGYYMGD